MIKILKNKLTAPLAALAAVAAFSAIPNMAQAAPYGRSEIEISYRQDRAFDFRGLERRIDQGVRNGDLTRREARRLNWQVDQLRDLADDYRRHGMTRYERRDLQARYDALSERVFYQRHDGEYGRRGWR